MCLVVTIHLGEGDLAAQLVRLLARKLAVRQALHREAEQRVGGALRGELVAADAVGVERLGAGLQREQRRCSLARLLGVAVDAGNLRLGHVGGEHGAVELRAALLHLAEPLGGRMLAELGARRLERGQHAAGVDALLALLRLELKDAVKDVRTSQRLTDSAVCLVADEGDLDIRLERLLKQHKQMQKMMKKFTAKGGMAKMMRGMGGMMPGGMPKM